MYLFCTWGYNPKLYYYVAQIVVVLAMVSSFLLVPCPFDVFHPFDFRALPYFLVLQDALGSFYISPALALKSAISSRSPGPPWRTVFRNRALGGVVSRPF